MAYSKVERRIHDDERYRRWARDVRQVWLYLLTTKHGNRLGLFVLDPLYAAADLSAVDDRWTEERVLAAVQVLVEDGRLAYESETRLVLLFNHLEHNAPENPNVVKGALTEIAELPFSAPLFAKLLGAIQRHCRKTTERGEPFASIWIEAVERRLMEGGANGNGNNSINGFGNGSGKGTPNPEPLPEPKPDPPSGDAREARSPEDGESIPEPAPARKGRGSPLVERPADWAPNEGHRSKAAAIGVDVEHEAEQFRHHHDARGNRFRSWDAAFHTWLGNAEKFGARRGRVDPTPAECVDGVARYKAHEDALIADDGHDERMRRDAERTAREAAWSAEMDTLWGEQPPEVRSQIEVEAEEYARDGITPSIRERLARIRRRQLLGERVGNPMPAGAR